MGFSFSLNDFLNYFSAGFIFTFGLSITNLEYTKIILPYLRDNINDGFIIIIIIFIYTMGIIIYGISAFLLNFSIRISKITGKKCKEILTKLCAVPVDFFLGRWTVIATYSRWSKKNKLPSELSQIKEYDDFRILVEIISEKSKEFSRMNFYRSQFFQVNADSILYVLIINSILVLFQLSDLRIFSFIWIAIVCLFLFFAFKIISLVFTEWYFSNTGKKAIALGLVGLDEIKYSSEKKITLK